VLISNVPGPPVPLYVDGLRMSGYWPLSIVEHGVGLNITLMSYAGTLCFGFVVARKRCRARTGRRFLAAFEDLLPPRWDELKAPPRQPYPRKKPSPCPRRRLPTRGTRRASAKAA
jgi:diacylglycerol O-acyltransferase